MTGFSIPKIGDILRGNTYPGRGLVVGTTADGACAVTAYFIMGRSANSRNRVFAEEDGAVFTRPFDASKVEDPRLIIYPAIRTFRNQLIVTNGDQTDTVFEGLQAGKSFFESLASRTFEPDAPNFTPRISALLTFEDGGFSYEISLLKSIDAAGSAPVRYGYSYPSVAGLGHFLHTYVCDGNPLPPFEGEPERVSIASDIDTVTNEIWQALDPDNRISLYVRFVDLASGEIQNRMVNRNGED